RSALDAPRRRRRARGAQCHGLRPAAHRRPGHRRRPRHRGAARAHPAAGRAAAGDRPAHPGPARGLTLLSASTVDRLRARFGPDVQSWLDGVPALVSRLCGRWGLEVVAKMTGGTSCTFRCRRPDGSGAYLKLTPDPDVFATEAAALRAWASSPVVVSLLDAADEDNALLIEALDPGT